MITARNLRVYRAATSRRGRTGMLWHIAAPDGAVLVTTISYPSRELLEDCVHAINHA